MFGTTAHNSRQLRPVEPLLRSAALVAVAAVGFFIALTPGPLASVMLLHVVTMNVAAPIAAAALHGLGARPPPRPQLLAAAIVQMALLWLLHLPPAVASPAVSLSLQMLLFAAAIAFWHAVAASVARRSWGAVGALLVTGKLACLVGALLVFSPRLMFETVGLCSATASSLDDQHLAGLLMITACPLSYLVAGVHLAAGLILDDDRRGGPDARLAAS